MSHLPIAPAVPASSADPARPRAPPLLDPPRTFSHLGTGAGRPSLRQPSPPAKMRGCECVRLEIGRDGRRFAMSISVMKFIKGSGRNSQPEKLLSFDERCSIKKQGSTQRRANQETCVKGPTQGERMVTRQAGERRNMRHTSLSTSQKQTACDPTDSVTALVLISCRDKCSWKRKINPP